MCGEKEIFTTPFSMIFLQGKCLMVGWERRAPRSPDDKRYIRIASLSLEGLKAPRDMKEEEIRRPMRTGGELEKDEGGGKRRNSARLILDNHASTKTYIPPESRARARAGILIWCHPCTTKDQFFLSHGRREGNQISMKWRS